MSDRFISVMLRFLRGFVAGGISSCAVLLGAGINVASTEDLQGLGIALLGAFLSGGLLALDKLLRLE